MLIHPTACVSAQAFLDSSVRVGPFAVVEAGAELSESVVVQAHAVVHGSASLGRGVTVGVHAVVGGDPQDLKFDARMPTRVVVGAETVLREGVTVHRSTGESPTRIGSNCLLMGGTHIGHDCVLGVGVVVSQLSGLGGHAWVGDHAVVGGMSGVLQWVRVGCLAMVGAKTKVERDVLPFSVVDGVPARHRGLNVVGIRRHAVSASEQVAVRGAFAALRNGDAPPDVPDGSLAAQVHAFLAGRSVRGTISVAPRPGLVGGRA